MLTHRQCIVCITFLGVQDHLCLDVHKPVTHGFIVLRRKVDGTLRVFYGEGEFVGALVGN